MKEAIKRIVLSLFPELSGGHHLPRWGKVVGVREKPNKGDIADEFRPYYAVNVQVLNAHGEPDLDYPVLHDVLVPIGTGGQESGQLSFPDDGTLVEIAFAYGSPQKPFIRCILPHNLSLPPLERGEQRQQFSDKSFARIASDGSHERVTDQTIKDDSFKRQVSAVESAEQFTKSVRTIEADDIHTIGGAKKVTADGGISLLGGERVELGSTGDVTLSATTEQSHKAPKTWIGSDGENVLRIVSELHAQVKTLTDVLSSHTHPTTGAITQGVQVTAIGTAVSAIKERLDGITK
jgi:hypothetical protein